MGFLSNKWVSYVQRSYAQIKTSVVTDNATRVPELTDHTESNIFIKMLDIWSGIAEMLGYYIDNMGREAFIDSCRRYSSAVAISKLMDYRIKGCTPATAEVTFVLNAPAPSNFTIPAGTKVGAGAIYFYTTSNLNITTGQTEGTVTAEEAETLSAVSLGASNGAESQTIILGGNIVDGSVAIQVNSLAWTGQETLGYSKPSDEHFVSSVDKDKNVIVRFGDDVNGKIPANGDPITADVKITQGENGNVDAFAIDTIVTSLTLPVGVTLTVENRERASGGGGVEALSSLKRRIPLYVRTLLRAVTTSDHIAIAELYSGVELAGVDYNCGKNVNVFIVPTGGGIATSTLCNNVKTWFADKKMVATNVNVEPAGEARIILKIDVEVLSNYRRTVVEPLVRANLLNFLSYQQQKIKGQVQVSDIYEIVDGTTGVNYSRIRRMSVRPYARPINGTTTVLNWARDVINTAAETVKWKIIMTSGTTFQLYRNNFYKGAYNTGTLYQVNEIEFNITAASYVLNDAWEFYTYPYSGTVVLAENSLPVSLTSDIDLVVTGGVV
jgi:hypothetical protein